RPDHRCQRPGERELRGDNPDLRSAAEADDVSCFSDQMAGKTSKASTTQPPGKALSPKHEAFVQAYVSRGMNGTKAYRAVYPKTKSDDVASAAAARLLGNVRVQARIAEIMRAGAERAEVTVEQVVRELKLIGFSDIRKVVSWRNELVTRTEKG